MRRVGDKNITPTTTATTTRAMTKPVLLMNQFVLTPGVGRPLDILLLLSGCLSLRPVSFATQLIPTLQEFFRQYANESWNLIMMDFIDSIPGLVSFLISLNFVAELVIVKATIGVAIGDNGGTDGPLHNNRDVTNIISKFIYRNKVLFLTNVEDGSGLVGQ
jgi:hypothetical protein